jgi:hypothetical protein
VVPLKEVLQKTSLCCAYHSHGIVYGVLYEWRKTLLAPLFVHVIYNCVVSGVALAAILASHNAPRLGVFGEAHESGLMITEVVPGSTAEEIGCAFTGLYQ